MSPNGLCASRSSGTVLDDGIVERQQSAIAQLHDRDARERFCNRRPVVDGAVAHRLPAFQVLQPFVHADDDLSVADDHQAAAGDAASFQRAPVAVGDGGPAGGSGGLAERGERARRDQGIELRGH